MASGRAAPSPLDTELNTELGEFSVAINSTKERPASSGPVTCPKQPLSEKWRAWPCPAHPYKQTLQGSRWRPSAPWPSAGKPSSPLSSTEALQQSTGR